MTTGFHPFETMIWQAFLDSVGDPVWLGLLIVTFFTAFVMLQGTRLDGKILVIVPALLLAAAFIPIITIVIGFGIGGLVFYAIMRFMNR